MDPKFVNTTHVLKKVRELKSRRKATKRTRKNYVDEITAIQNRITAIQADPNNFYRNVSLEYAYGRPHRYISYLRQLENTLNNRVVNLENQISGYNDRLVRAQFFAPFDDINLNDDDYIIGPPSDEDKNLYYGPYDIN